MINELKDSKNHLKYIIIPKSTSRKHVNNYFSSKKTINFISFVFMKFTFLLMMNWIDINVICWKSKKIVITTLNSKKKNDDKNWININNIIEKNMMTINNNNTITITITKRTHITKKNFDIAIWRIIVKKIERIHKRDKKKTTQHCQCAQQIKMFHIVKNGNTITQCQNDKKFTIARWIFMVDKIIFLKLRIFSMNKNYN